MTHIIQGKSLLTDELVAVKNARVYTHQKTKMAQFAEVRQYKKSILQISSLFFFLLFFSFFPSFFFFFFFFSLSMKYPPVNIQPLRYYHHHHQLNQELCESRGGRPGLPFPNSPYGLCGRKATLNPTPTPPPLQCDAADAAMKVPAVFPGTRS